MTIQDSSSGAARAREPLFAITLSSSAAPIPIPNVPESHLRGLALFKSRRVDDGRERFRLHLGYFSTVDEAERVLALVRRGYPSAMISPVPQASAGSLDSTALTRFTILQPPPPAHARSVMPIAPTPVKTSGQSVQVAPVADAMPPSELALPESRAATSAPAQRYAVQLAFGQEPIDLSHLPELAIYDGYLLYAVETTQAGRQMYGVRLGFYDDLLSARLVAQYVRSEFKDVSIVPVSTGEIDGATGARIRLPTLRVVRSRTQSLPLWPSRAIAIIFDPRSQLTLVK